MKTYMVQIEFDGEMSCKLMTERELAEHWEMNDLAGVGYEYKAFDVDTFGKATPINVYEAVRKALEQKRWMEQEYQDYCEAERYN